jgi:hypothetical protein
MNVKRIIATAALSVGLSAGIAGTADAATHNPWGHRVHSKSWSVKHWQRYAHNHHAHHLGKIDGHARCWVIYGPTSYVSCKDGYRTTS